MSLPCKLLKLAPADFQKAVDLKDDDLETIATLTTKKVCIGQQ